MNLKPEIEGEHSIGASETQFIEALKRRIHAGFLSGQAGPRQSYVISNDDGSAISIRADNMATAINVGLNDLELDFSEDRKIVFRLRFWRWASFCIILCATIGLIGMITFLTIDIRQFIANNANARIPGLTIDQNVILAWGNIVFWGFLWPWVLVAIHKRSLRALLGKIFDEIDKTAMKTRTLTT